MQLSAQTLEQLLYEEEGPTLDFKRDQYPFEGAGNDDKSELLKDILAFINAWRRSDAYILIGVDEVRGGKSRVVGVTTHLDDAKLQQFVNSKTQRPVHFSYRQATIDNQNVGVIHIPPQERPVYLTKGFGKLEKGTVYVRRSSSTDIAAPDEIAKMGQVVAGSFESMPLLEIQFYDSEGLAALGTSVEIETVNLSLPEDFEIPDYGVMQIPIGPNMFHTMESVGKNREYYRQTAVYLKKTMETSRVDFIIYNVGTVPARDVRLELVVADQNRSLIFRDAADMPEEPFSTVFFGRVAQPTLNLDVNVQRANDGHHITAHLGKIQAKAKAHTSSGLFIGSRDPQTIELKARIFADNLPAPREANLRLDLRPREDSLSVEGLMGLVEGKTPNKGIDGDEE